MIVSERPRRGVFLRSLAIGAAFACLAPPSDAQTTLSEKNVESFQGKFPIRIPKGGALALHLQILLDRAGFSPGIIDGAWGVNAAKAITFFTRPDDPERLTGDAPATITTVDRVTYERLRKTARSKALLKRYRITSDDLRGPFTPIPASVYDQAKLKCLCYATPVEALSERFHSSRKLLQDLNPKVDFNKLKAGTMMLVPNVELDGAAVPQDTAIIARVIISKKHFWTHAVDTDGRIIYHFPSTLGAGYDPSPTGDVRVTYVSRDPSFKYQPKLFSEVPDDEPESKLPPGPNSPVGRVWMSLSKPHYGIHGTSSPETIGYANSHVSLRLTKWDALRLSDLVDIRTPVQFR